MFPMMTKILGGGSKRSVQGVWILAGLALAASLLAGGLDWRSQSRCALDELSESHRNLARSLAEGVRGAAARGNPGAGFAALRERWSTAACHHEGSFLCVVGETGRILLHSSMPRMVGTDVSGVAIPAARPGDPATVGALLAAHGEWAGMNRNVRGIEQLAAYAYSDGLGGLVAVHVPARVVRAEIATVALPWAAGLFGSTLLLFPAGMMLLLRAMRGWRRRARAATGELGHTRGLLDRARDELEDLREQAHRAREQARGAREAQHEYAASRVATAGFAHDLQNALAPVAGFAELLARQDQVLRAEPKLASYVDRIRAGTRDAVALVRRMRNGEPQAVSLRQVVQDVLGAQAATLGTEAARRGVTLSFRAAPRGDPQVLGQPAEIRAAVTNLLRNAAEASSRDGTIEVRTSIDHALARLDVLDEGDGMPPEVRARALKPFFTTKEPGPHPRGLGLARVHDVMVQHGGSIEIANRERWGLRVTLRFPLHAEEDAPRPPAGG